MPVYHSLTMTTPDNPAYENRPSHWNEAHSIDLSGSEVIGAFSNAGNVSFAVETNGRITASANVTAAASPVNVTAGTTSGNLQTIAFSNSNGVSFGLNGSTITASHNGLTTAAQSNQVVNSLNGSTGQVSLNVGSSLSASTNGSSITFGLASNITTALQPAGAYLTTARASNDAIGTNTALTAGPLAWTANSAGLSLNAGSVAGTTSGFTGANISASITHNTAGLAMSMSVAAAGGAASQTLYATGNTTVNSSGTMALSSLLMRGYGIVSLGTSNGSILVSSPDPTTLAPSWYAVGNTTGASSSTTLAADTISIQGTGGVSVGYSNGSLVISGNTGGGGGGVGLSAGTQSVSTGTVVFSNSNNVSFGMSGSSHVTASVGANLYALGNTTQNSSTVLGVGALSLNALGAMTAGFSNGSIQLSAPATSSLSASGAVSISTNGATISIGVGTVTAYATSNTTQNSSGTINLNSLLLHGAGIASVGYSNGSVVVSVPSGGGAGDGVNILAAGTQTAATTGTVAFADSNGITFGMSNSSVITASHNGLTSQSNQAWSGSNASSTFQTLSFNNANGASWSNNGGAVELSYTVPTQTNQTVGGYFVGNTTGQSSSSTVDARSISFDGAGIVSAGWSAGSVRISATQSNQAASAANGSFAFQTVNFSNANGVSFVTSAGSAIAASVETSYAASNHSHGNPTLALTNLSGTTASNSAGLTLSLSAAAPGGGVTPAISAANGSYSFSTLSLSNANGFSFGTSAGSAITGSYTVPSVTQYFSATNTTFNGANISGSMTLNTNGLQLSMSVAAPGAAAENNAINLLGANTAGNTTATGSTIGWSGVNVTLSGTNASQVVISAPATSSLVGVSGVSVSTNGSTISVYDNVTLSGYLEGVLDRELLAAQIGNAQLFVQPLRLRNHVQFNEICEMVNFSNASNSSNSATLSLLVGFYTRNNSSLSLITSASSSYAITASGTVGSYSIYGGPREYPIGFTTTLTKGDYYIGFLSRTTTGGGAGMTWSNFVGSNINSAYSGRFSSANNATNQFVLGQGSYTVTTTAIPGSIAFSQINGSAAENLRPVIYKLASGDLN